MNAQPNNPLHGITLEAILTALVQHFGWYELSCRIQIRCFTLDPSIKSSLVFLRNSEQGRADLKMKTYSKNAWKI
jgi:uncharacterized protein (DUF2132 family)